MWPTGRWAVESGFESGIREVQQLDARLLYLIGALTGICRVVRLEWNLANGLQGAVFPGVVQQVHHVERSCLLLIRPPLQDRLLKALDKESPHLETTRDG